MAGKEFLGGHARCLLQIALQKRRQQTNGDCRQVKADVDSYNENFNMYEPLQMFSTSPRIWQKWGPASIGCGRGHFSGSVIGLGA
jgi:hypothetical protein